MSDLDLEGVEPQALVDVLAMVLRRVASDLAMAHELSPATKENP